MNDELNFPLIDDKDINLAIYCRISTNQDKQKYSLADQQDEGVKFANLNKYKAFIYKDEKSGGTIEGRPQLLRLIGDIDEGLIGALWIINWDRLSRGDENDTYVIKSLLIDNDIKLYERGALVRFDTSDDVLMFDIKAAFARHERLKIKERVKRGLAKKKNLGLKTHHRFYGYDLVNNEMVNNHEEAETVKFIFEKFNEGYSFGKIEERLKYEDHKRKNGSDTWTHSFITAILKKPEYAGFTFNTSGEKIKSLKFPAIIDLSVWDKAQKRLSKNKKKKNQNNRLRKYPLSGVIKCGNCGTGFYIRSTPKMKKSLITCDNPQGRYTYYYYYHRNISKAACECPTTKTSFKMQMIDNLVTAIYCHTFSDVEQTKKLLEIQKDKLIEDNSNPKKEIEIIRNRISSLKDKRERILKVFDAGMREWEETQSLVEPIMKELNELDEKIKILSAETETDKLNSLIEIQSYTHIVDYLCMDSNEKKKMYLKNFDSITIQDGILKIRAVSGQEHEINLRDIPEFWKVQIDLMEVDMKQWEINFLDSERFDSVYELVTDGEYE